MHCQDFMLDLPSSMKDTEAQTGNDEEVLSW